MNLAKLVSLGIAIFLIQACSHPIDIEGQGDVVSPDGTIYCTLEQEPCPNVVTGDYIRTYVGEPRSGWEFERWEGCGTQHPNCSFNIPAAVVDQFWFQIMPPLKAVFCLMDDTDCDGLADVDDPCPANPTNPCALITDIVHADGKEWAQPDLFDNLTWSDVNSVCPAGVCSQGAVLQGKDLTGWKWASANEVQNLYRSVVPEPNLLTCSNIVVGMVLLNAFRPYDIWLLPWLAAGGWYTWVPEAADTYVYVLTGDPITLPPQADCEIYGQIATDPTGTSYIRFSGWFFRETN